jgi:Fe-S-cluster containining protein
VLALRIDPEQRFSCAQCGRCCRRGEVVVSDREVESFRKRDAARWFRERDDAPEGAERDPFEPIPFVGGFHRIRQREDGACGFLSPQNRCRLHEELGGRRKPLTCRMFPLRFHPAADAVVVTASFSCPTVVAGTGERLASGDALSAIKALRTEWFARHPYVASPLVFVPGRSIESDSLGTLRECLLTMLDRVDGEGRRDLRANVLRMAHSLEDLARHRVVRLEDAAFGEYLSLTTRHAASTNKAAAPRPPSRVGRLLQRGFLFLVCAMRLRVDHRQSSRFAIRLRLLRLLAHFHRLAPALDRVNVRALRRVRVDVDAPEIQPIVRNYLRGAIESLGTGERPVLEEMSVAVSYLNSACALAVMNAAAGRRPIDREVFVEALMEAMELTHAGGAGLVGRSLRHLCGGAEALFAFAHCSPLRGSRRGA